MKKKLLFCLTSVIACMVSYTYFTWKSTSQTPGTYIKALSCFNGAISTIDWRRTIQAAKYRSDYRSEYSKLEACRDSSILWAGRIALQSMSFYMEELTKDSYFIAHSQEAKKEGYFVSIQHVLSYGRDYFEKSNKGIEQYYKDHPNAPKGPRYCDYDSVLFYQNIDTVKAYEFCPSYLGKIHYIESGIERYIKDKLGLNWYNTMMLMPDLIFD